MMLVLYNVGGEMAVEKKGGIHYRGEKTGVLIVDEGIGYLDLLSRVKWGCGNESEGPLLLFSMRIDDDSERCRALLQNSSVSIASMASPPPPLPRLLRVLPEFEIPENRRTTANGTPLLLEYLSTNDISTSATTTTVVEMASPPSSHLQLLESEASENHLSIPTSSETPLLLESSTAISSTSPPSPESPENDQYSIPTSSVSPLLLVNGRYMTHQSHNSRSPFACFLFWLISSCSTGEDDAPDGVASACDKFKIQKPKLVDVEWVSTLAKSLMERDLPCEEQDIMEEICDKYGYDVDLEVVQKSRNLALQVLGLLEDDYEEKQEVEVKEPQEKQQGLGLSGSIFTLKKPKLEDEEWIYNLAKSLVERDFQCTKKQIVDKINNEFGYDVDYILVRKCRNLALGQLGLTEDDDQDYEEYEEENPEKWLYFESTETNGINSINDRRKPSCLNQNENTLSSLPPYMVNMADMSNTTFMADMQDMGDMAVTGMYSNLQNGCSPTLKSKEVSEGTGISSSDTSGSEKGVSVIRSFWRNFLVSS